MSGLNRQDADLHYECCPDEHKSTAPTTGSRALANYETRLRAHLETHRTTSELKEDAVTQAEDFRVWIAEQAFTAPDASWNTIRDSLTARLRDAGMMPSADN